MKTTRISRLNIQLKLVKVLLSIFGVICMLSCNDEDELILESSLLQGTWVEVEPEDLLQFAGTNHTFTFREDSFYLKLVSWTDVVYVDEDGNLIEGEQFGYIKGEYSFDLDKVYFDGVRCLDSNFIQSAPVEVPAFNVTYPYKLKSLKTLVLNPESEYESITLVKE